MGAMKDLAIELEARQESAVMLGDPAVAYRLGMLEACRLICDVSGRVIKEPDTDPFNAVTDCWKWVFDAACYLKDVSQP